MGCKPKVARGNGMGAGDRVALGRDGATRAEGKRGKALKEAADKGARLIKAPIKLVKEKG